MKIMTGVYVFDSYLKNARENLKIKNIRVCLQYHDELMAKLPAIHREFVEVCLRSAMDKVNQDLGLNVRIGSDIQFGKNYAEIH